MKTLSPIDDGDMTIVQRRIDDRRKQQRSEIERIFEIEKDDDGIPSPEIIRKMPFQIPEQPRA